MDRKKKKSGPAHKPGKPAADPAAKPPSNAPPASSGGEKSAPATDFNIVGIGASAGGLEAVTALLQSLPQDTGMAFVLVQHLAPKHTSALVEILSKCTSLPVRDIHDGMPVEPDTIFIIPPASDLTIERGLLRLADRPESRTPARPVDAFFTSLAADAKACAIGVVLSGTGNDGTRGMKAIKEAGGITFAQDVSAAHHGMPDSAVAGECVDFVLAPDRIATELARIARHPCGIGSPEGRPQAAAAPDSAAPNALAAVLRLLTTKTGIDFTHYKQPTVRRRIERRMMVKRQESIGAYLECLRAEPGELEALYHELLIQVTSFFRDPDVFESLKLSVFPELLKKRQYDAPLRIWVPGCATGEEVYSLAICLLEYLKDNAPIGPIRIFATDVSEPAIEKARSGIYQEGTLAEVSPDRLRQYFIKNDNGYQIVKHVRDMCIFARQNVSRDPPFSQLDLVSCRNVLIYLDTALQNRVIPVFHYALRPGGFLVLGSAESVGTFADLFVPFDKKHRVYQRTNTSSRLTFDYAASTKTGRLLAVSEIKGEPQLRLQDIQREADRVVLAKYAPAGVVIDEALEIVQFRGQTGACLEPAPGAPSSNLLQMAREGLLPDLRAAIEAAKASGLPERRHGIRIKSNSHFSLFDIEIIPITVPASSRRCFVVLFEVSGPAAQGAAAPVKKNRRPPPAALPAASDPMREIALLSQELSATRAYLQSVIEAKEAGNEELKAANEEIISSNEELQSTNEELETAKEELQATNEELATVNDELQDRIRAATQLNDDLTNLIDSVNIPILMLGEDLRLRRFSPSAQTVLNLRPGDIGRHISDFKPKINVPDLVPYIHRVLDSLKTEEREVTDAEGHWYTMSIRPYRTGENKIDGATLTLMDIDVLKRKEAQISAARDFARAIIGALRGAILVLDFRLRVRFANRAFYEFFQVHADETENQSIYALAGGHWNIPALRTLIDKVAASDELCRDVRVESEFSPIGRKALLINARRISAVEDDSPVLQILLSIEDVTQRETAEREARQTAARMQAVVERATDAIIMFDEQGRVESINQAGELMFRYVARDLVGQPVSRLWSDGFRDEFEASLVNSRSAHRSLLNWTEKGILGLRRDGTRFPVEMTVSSIDTGERLLYMVILRDMTQRHALEREVLEIASYEQRRIGQDLHDSTGQVLSGLSYLARGLAAGLDDKAAPEAETARLITNELERATEQLRRISKGLVPVDVDSQGLISALQSLASRVAELGNFECQFVCPDPVSIDDSPTALQLYLITQEATNNALKHAHAEHVTISLASTPELLTLSVEDDGDGIGDVRPTGGMGLKIMNYRADLLGARLSVERRPEGGTRVTCELPADRDPAGGGIPVAGDQSG